MIDLSGPAGHCIGHSMDMELIKWMDCFTRIYLPLFLLSRILLASLIDPIVDYYFQECPIKNCNNILFESN